jgi:hypothetical protein
MIFLPTRDDATCGNALAARQFTPIGRYNVSNPTLPAMTSEIDGSTGAADPLAKRAARSIDYRFYRFDRC